MNILLFFIVLLVVVLVHEAGHFFVAKFFKIRVDEFGFGFPPKAVTLFKKGETEYTLNWLPIGGFVKIYGENPDLENTNGPDANRSFVNKPRWQQALVLFAGVFMNFILAWVLFSIGFMSGLPTSLGSEPKGYTVTDTNLVVVSVLPGSPAEEGGLATGDKIKKVENLDQFENVRVLEEITPENFRNFVLASKDKTLNISYTRGKDEELKTASINPKLNEENKIAIGIAMDTIGTLKLPFFTSLSEGMKLTLFQTQNTAVGLFNLIKNSVLGKADLSSVSGPVGMTKIIGDAYDFGFIYLLSFTALISVNLAIINLVPFPALDGGRLLFLLIEKIKGSRLNPKFANGANMIGFALLIIFMLVITYHDITRLF
jgi:regulator of sigma E protease